MQFDPVLTEIYKTVITGAPYVLAAYAALLIGFYVYITLVLVRVGKVQKQLDALRAVVDRRESKGAETGQ